MRKSLLPLSAFAVVFGLAACGTPVGGPAPSSTSSSSSSSETVAPSTPAAGSSTDTGSTPDPVTDFRITYGFAVPSSTVSVDHPFTPPPLRRLVGIYAGDHPSESPAYQRISFYFTGGYPTYKFSYVPSVVSDGRGEPVPLPGNAFLRIVFTQSQAHTDSGGSSIIASPPASLGYPNLKGYKAAGDFEGYVTYGLGIQVASGSDQALPIRTGELTRDEPGGKRYVVFFDVRTG